MVQDHDTMQGYNFLLSQRWYFEAVFFNVCLMSINYEYSYISSKKIIPSGRNLAEKSKFS
jgi:hypothetical protein